VLRFRDEPCVGSVPDELLVTERAVQSDEQALSRLDSPATSPVEKLRRWEAMGAVWRVTARTSSLVTVSLLRCDGGEEVERVVSDDPGLIAFIADRSASDC
jgi:hypothetical protein